MTTAKIGAAMGGARKLSLALVAALCAAVLAACGGGGDSTSSTATDATGAESTAEAAVARPARRAAATASRMAAAARTAQAAAPRAAPAAEGGDGSSGGAELGGGSSGVSGSASFHFSGEPTKHDHPAPVEGSRSDGFRVPGGDNSIQEYGEEQDSDERAAAMAPIAALYRALFSGDWNEGLRHLPLGQQRQADRTARPDKPTAEGQGLRRRSLAASTRRPARTAPTRRTAASSASGPKATRGFAIYWGTDGKGYAFAAQVGRRRAGSSTRPRADRPLQS